MIVIALQSTVRNTKFIDEIEIQNVSCNTIYISMKWPGNTTHGFVAISITCIVSSLLLSLLFLQT